MITFLGGITRMERSVSVLTLKWHYMTVQSNLSVCNVCLPSCAMILRVTLRPASLISLTISACGMLTMDWPFTARIRSPTFSFPQRSAGLPSMMRPILWGTAVGRIQVKMLSVADLTVASPVRAHTKLARRLTESGAVFLVLQFSWAYVRHPEYFCVCGRSTDAHSSIVGMCVTDVLWEDMYNWRARLRDASLFIQPWLELRTLSGKVRPAP